MIATHTYTYTHMLAHKHTLFCTKSSNMNDHMKWKLKADSTSRLQGMNPKVLTQFDMSKISALSIVAAACLFR